MGTGGQPPGGQQHASLEEDVRLYRELCADVASLHDECGDILCRVEVRQSRAADLMVDMMAAVLRQVDEAKRSLESSAANSASRRRRRLRPTEDCLGKLLAQGAGKGKAAPAAPAPAQQSTAAAGVGPTQASHLLSSKLYDDLQEVCRHSDLADLMLHRMQKTHRESAGQVQTLVRSAEVLADIVPKPLPYRLPSEAAEPPDPSLPFVSLCRSDC